jgi:hypothetical protein
MTKRKIQTDGGYMMVEKHKMPNGKMMKDKDMKKKKK